MAAKPGSNAIESRPLSPPVVTCPRCPGTASSAPARPSTTRMRPGCSTTKRRSVATGCGEGSSACRSCSSRRNRTGRAAVRAARGPSSSAGSLCAGAVASALAELVLVVTGRAARDGDEGRREEGGCTVPCAHVVWSMATRASKSLCRPTASQPGSVLCSGRRGPQFKSGQPDLPLSHSNLRRNPLAPGTPVAASASSHSAKYSSRHDQAVPRR